MGEDSMVEKVSKAICCPRGCCHEPCVAYQCGEAAHAAIEAMRTAPIQERVDFARIMLGNDYKVMSQDEWADEIDGYTRYADLD